MILTTEAVLEEGLMGFVLHRVGWRVLVGHVGGRAREGMVGRVAVEDHGVVAASVLLVGWCSEHVLLLSLLLRTAIALILIVARPLVDVHISSFTH